MKNLGFGMMRLPLMEQDNQESINLEVVKKMVDYFMEKGFTYFDTAYPYHIEKSEAAVKKAIVERYPRESFILADKMPTWKVTKNEDYQRIFDEQLERCGVSYFDYYMLHDIGASAYADTLKYGGFEFMEKLKAEGKAKHIGLSYHDDAELLERILLEHPEMEFVQLQINYIDWDSESIQSRKCYEAAIRHKMPIIVMEPVKGGSLANIPAEADKLFKDHHHDLSTTSWAIRFAASLKNVFMVLSGMSNFEQLADNVSYMQKFMPIDDEEREIIRKAKDIIDSIIAIPCTSCQYCVDGCPKNIPIPKYFSLYNNQNQFGLGPASQDYYGNLAYSFGKASDCIDCKQCEQICPQHIGVAEQMKEVSRVFEG